MSLPTKYDEEQKGYQGHDRPNFYGMICYVVWSVTSRWLRFALVVILTVAWLIALYAMTH